MTFFEKRRPYFILKWAQTADGFLARAQAAAAVDNRISGPEAQTMVHALRAGSMGILVGKNTAMVDNPQLTTRLVAGKHPVRLLIDPRLEVPRQYHLYNGEAPLIIFNAQTTAVEGPLRFVQLDFTRPLPRQVAAVLYELGFQSVLVEGGARVLSDFLSEGVWDEALVFENPTLRFGAGVKAPAFELPVHFDVLGNDRLYRVQRTGS